MRSELFRIPIDLGSIPLLGIGVLLLAWGAASAVLITRHLRSAGDDDRDLWGVLTPALIGAAAIVVAPRFFPEGIPVRGYGVMLLTAVSTGVAMAVHRARERGVSADTVFALTFWLFVGGIGGARAFFVVEYWEVRFAGQSPLATVIDVLRFTEGGLVVYGSLIGATIAFVLFARRHGLPVVAMGDLLAPCFVAGLAIGRIGCLLNGCCYGGVCDVPWSVTFPEASPPFVDQLIHGQLHGVRVEMGPDGPVLTAAPDGGGVGERVAAIDRLRVATEEDVAAAFGAAYGAGRGVELVTASGATISTPPVTSARSLPIHPTQLYSAINAGLLSWLLWSWRPRRHGEVVLLLMTIYPVSRFLLEVIRTDESAIFGTGMSISQNVSVVLLAVAALGWGVLFRRGEPALRGPWAVADAPEKDAGTITAKAS